MHVLQKIEMRIRIRSIRSPFRSVSSIPVIQIPKYASDFPACSKKRSTATAKRPAAERAKLISWTGDRKLFHHFEQRYSDREPLPSIGKLFLSESSNGHRLIIHNCVSNPSEMLVDGATFQALGLQDYLAKAIHSLVSRSESVKPSTIQYAVIPSILAWKNLLFSAETGSGKTIAYLAPLLQMLMQNGHTGGSLRRPRALIVSPSRELTEQIGQVARNLAASCPGLGVATMIGGHPKGITSTGFDLIVTTIGMVHNHLNAGLYSLKSLRHLVLDEADTLLDDSFAFETMDLLEKINLNRGQNVAETQIPNGTQLICASATVPRTLHSTIGSLLDTKQDLDQVSTQNLNTIPPNIRHVFYRVNRYRKDVKLFELLLECRASRQPCIVFGNRTAAVDWLFRTLNDNGFHCVRLTAGMDEKERITAFQSFQQGLFDILVATDLGSRGLDSSRARHVINFDSPHYAADYIHRAGRTGRLGTANGTRCTVSTLISYKPDAYMLMELERAVRLGQPVGGVDANIKAQLSLKRADKRAKLQRNHQ